MEIVEYKARETPSRRMWVYGSMKEFLAYNASTLNQTQMKESGLASVVLTKEQKISLKGGLRKVLWAMWNGNDRLDSHQPEPLYLNIPGNPLGDTESAVADFDNVRKIHGSNNYDLPIRIFSNAD